MYIYIDVYITKLLRETDTQTEDDLCLLRNVPIILRWRLTSA